MAAEVVELTGSARTGLILSPEHFKAMIDAPHTQAVRLGRRRPDALPDTKRAFRFASLRATIPIPDSVDWATKAAPSISRMYKNDTYGDCVIAGKGHCFGIWSANDPDSGGVIVGTDTEIVQQYQSWCGPGDNGCVIEDVLKQIQSGGMTLGGKRYMIDAYVPVDWTSKTEVQASLLILPGSTIGVNLPEAWTNSAIWDVTNSSIVGGHDVTVIDYNATGPRIASWAKIYQMTWAAFMSKKWVEEFWVTKSPVWYNADRIAGSGYSVADLDKALAAFQSGQLPDVTPPGPPVPPTPPAPPVPVVTEAMVAAMVNKGVSDYLASNAAKIKKDPFAGNLATAINAYQLKLVHGLYAPKAGDMVWYPGEDSVNHPEGAL